MILLRLHSGASVLCSSQKKTRMLCGFPILFTVCGSIVIDVVVAEFTVPYFHICDACCD